MGSFKSTPAVVTTASAKKNATTSNYSSILDFTETQFLPDVYKEQVHKYGNRMITGFLQKVSAEYPVQSASIQWAEEGRLELRYDSVTRATSKFTITGHELRKGQVVKVADAAGDVSYGLVVDADPDSDGNKVTLASYHNESTNGDGGWGDTGTSGLTVIVVGSEFNKGSAGMDGSIEREYDTRENNPIILKDKYSVAGSDAAQIGWVEVTDENGGAGGYLWYLQSEIDTRARFQNSIEKSLLEGVPAETSTTANLSSPASEQTGIFGHEGLFYVLENHGNVFTGGFNDAGSPADGRADFDKVVKRLDKQGNIMENQFYLDRDESLAIDNILAMQGAGGIGGGGYDGTNNAQFQYGSNFGMFNNSSDMAMNLGFVGFKRGSYQFYKTDWKYLNDESNGGAFTTGAAQVQGVMIPGGSSSVYDQGLNRTIKRPMLHVRYRAAEGENRKFKNWVTGSVGGVYTDDNDRMDVHYLTERCLITQAANNFILFKGA